MRGTRRGEEQKGRGEWGQKGDKGEEGQNVLHGRGKLLCRWFDIKGKLAIKYFTQFDNKDF